MGNENVTAGSTTEPNIRRIVLWILGLFGSMYMLYYEYVWSRFVFHNRATVSFSGWFWASLAIAMPWTFGFASVNRLGRAARNGRADDDVSLFLDISMLVEMAVLSAYWMLAAEVQRLTSLGVIK